MPHWSLITLLVVLIGILVFYQGVREQGRHADDWKKAEQYEPVLGATGLSFLTVPVYRILRLLCVDVLSAHFAFVVGTGWMMRDLIKDLAKNGWVVPTALVVLHGIAWVNFAFPDHRKKFVEAIIAVVNAFAERLKTPAQPRPAWPGSPYQASPAPYAPPPQTIGPPGPTQGR